AADKAEHLVLARLRQDAQFVGFDECGKLVGIARQPEEVVLLLNHLWRRQMFRAESVYQLVLGVEMSPAPPIEASIGTRVDIAMRGTGLPELAHAIGMAGIYAGTYEVVVGEVELVA